MGPFAFIGEWLTVEYSFHSNFRYSNISLVTHGRMDVVHNSKRSAKIYATRGCVSFYLRSSISERAPSRRLPNIARVFGLPFLTRPRFQCRKRLQERAFWKWQRMNCSVKGRRRWLTCGWPSALAPKRFSTGRQADGPGFRASDYCDWTFALHCGIMPQTWVKCWLREPGEETLGGGPGLGIMGGLV
jgi:hypothetical protein